MRNSKCQLAQVAIVGLLSGYAAATSAANIEVSIDVGNLQVGTRNNEFLAVLATDGADIEQAKILAIANGSFVLGQTSALVSIAGDPTFIYDYHFSVAAPAVMSKNATYYTAVGSRLASMTLLLGSTVVWEATRTDSTVLTFGSDFDFPSTVLQPNEKYSLVLTTRGLVPGEYPYSTDVAWGQIALDISPVPEPLTQTLFVGGLMALFARRSISRQFLQRSPSDSHPQAALSN